MYDLAQKILRCECGSPNLETTDYHRPGELTICQQCGKVWRLDLVAVPWPEVELELADRPWDLCAFAWVRTGVKPPQDAWRNRAKALAFASLPAKALAIAVLGLVVLEVVR